MDKPLRPNTNYMNVQGLTILDKGDLLSIELMAKTLNVEEALAVLFLQLDELTEHEINLVNRAWRKGRNKAVQEAGDHLFAQMRTRNGTVAALEYLKQMSTTFQLVVSPSTSSGSGFNFNVYPPGTRPEGVSTVDAPAEVIPIKGDK